MLKRWDFWYSGVLLEHWLPGPASDWAGVLAGEKPPSRVRKKLAAAAVEAQYDAALGAGLGIPFFAKVLEWSQTGGTTHEQNCMVEAGTGSLLTKVHPKKKPQSKKTRR